MFPINDADGSIDSNVFNSNVMVLPVSIKALTSMSKKAHGGGIHYWVGVETLEGGLSDVSKKAEFNVLHPSLSVVKGPRLTGAAQANYGGSQFFADLGKGFKSPTLTVLRKSNYADEGGLGLMLVHSDNMPGHQVQVIPIAKLVTTTKVSAASSVRRAVAGHRTWPPSLQPRPGLGCRTGTVAFYDNGVLLGQEDCCLGPGSARVAVAAAGSARHRGALPRHDGRLADQQDLGPGHRHLTPRPGAVPGSDLVVLDGAASRALSNACSNSSLADRAVSEVQTTVRTRSPSVMR